MWSNVEAVIFDMDGVLVDSEPIHFLAESSTFRSLGISVPREEHVGYLGLRQPEMWELVKKRHSLPQSLGELLVLHLQNLQRMLTAKKIEAIRYVPHLLQTLMLRGIRIALASSSPTRIVNLILCRAGLENKFDCIIAGEDVLRGKPAPDAFLAACDGLHVGPSRAIVIEDSQHGVQAAKAAGIRCIGLKISGAAEQDLSKADLVVASVAEIETVLFHSEEFSARVTSALLSVRV